jgi:hypothetical protein
MPTQESPDMPSGVGLAQGSRVDGKETGKKMQGGQENFSAPMEGIGLNPIWY